MRSLVVIAPLIAVLNAASTSARAQGDEPTETPKPPQKPGDKLIALFADAIGTWKCTATVTMPGVDAVEVPATAKISAVLEGFAYALDYATAPKTGTGNKVMVVWNQDPLTGKLSEAGWDSMGASWRGTSVGLRGEKAVWSQEGAAGGDLLKMRTTYVRKGKNEMQRIAETLMPDGRWARTTDETCKR